MKIFRAKAQKRQTLIGFALLGMLFSYQNCGSSFEVLPGLSNSLNENSEIPEGSYTPPTAALGLSVSNLKVRQTQDLGFQIVLKEASPASIVVNYETVAGTALAGTDYLATKGSVTIPAGALSADVIVPTLRYSVLSESRTLSLRITATSGDVSEAAVAQAEIAPAFEKPKFKSLSAGWDFTCGLTLNDTIGCWGSYMALLNKKAPGYAVVDGTAGARSLVLGERHACFITPQDTVKCFGGALTLGNGTRNESAVPVEVSGLSGVKFLAAGSRRTCAIDGANKLKCWGANSAEGSLGDGSTEDALTPREVPGLLAKSVSVGSSETSCALTMNDTVVCWGANQFGQLGDGTSTPSRAPVAVAGLSGIKSISTGNTAACAITNQNAVFCWGLGFGEIDQFGSRGAVLTPINIPDFAGAQSVQVGLSTVCAQDMAGQVRCMGSNSNGAFGPTNIKYLPNPTLVAGSQGTKGLALGPSYMCQLAADDTSRCTGRLTAGDYEGGPAATFVDSPDLNDVKMLTTGILHGCILTSKNTVRCWGANTHGQLGNGTFVDSAKPVDVDGLTDVKEIGTGRNHSCALTSGGKVWCWGGNREVETAVARPVDLGVSGVKSLIVSHYTVCVLTEQNVGRCMPAGFASGGSALADVPGLSGIRSISLGQWGHACAVTMQETVKCWGANNFGQVGNGRIGIVDGEEHFFVAAPVDVPGLSGVQSLSLSGYSSYALMKNGSVKAWGNGASGQLANASMANSGTPIDIAGLSGVKSIFAKESQACAILADGVLKCWGYDSFATSSQATPTTVPYSGPVAGFAHGISVVGSIFLFDQHSRVRVRGGIYQIQDKPVVLYGSKN